MKPAERGSCFGDVRCSEFQPLLLPEHPSSESFKIKLSADSLIRIRGRQSSKSNLQTDSVFLSYSREVLGYCQQCLSLVVVHKYRAPGLHGDYIVTVTPNICGSSVWKLLRVTFWFLDFEVTSRFLENLCVPHLYESELSSKESVCCVLLLYLNLT
jgi:hypothetical protein